MCIVNFKCGAFTVPANFPLPDFDKVTEDFREMKKVLVLDTKSGQYVFHRFYKEEDGSYTIPKQLIKYEGPWNGFGKGYGWSIPILSIDEIHSTNNNHFITGSKGSAEKQYLLHRAREGYLGDKRGHYTNAVHEKELLQKLEELFAPIIQGLNQLENPDDRFLADIEEFIEMDVAPPSDDGGWDSI